MAAIADRKGLTKTPRRIGKIRLIAPAEERSAGIGNTAAVRSTLLVLVTQAALRYRVRCSDCAGLSGGCDDALMFTAQATVAACDPAAP